MSKETTVLFKMVPLKNIICESNRKNTKDDGFEQLKSSIEKHGIIQPPVLRSLDNDEYVVIAGRRRIEAARQIKIVDTSCIVYSKDDPRSDEEIALSENVNRLEMHPLDEAALFQAQADKGTGVEEIAKYYARSPSAIYKRLRLSGLTDENKTLFRDGKLNIAGAAVLAELPEEDQKDFHNIYKNKEQIENVNIFQFVQNKQRYAIKRCMKNCQNCMKRTHNQDNTLFDEFKHLNDVCLDADCYRQKWYEMIETALNIQITQYQEAGLQTDDKILFSGSVLEQMYKKATKARFIIGADKQTVDFQVLQFKNYDFTEQETNRKKDACWKIKCNWEGQLEVRRIGYKERPPRVKPDNNESDKDNKNEGAKRVKEYGKEVLEFASADYNIKPAELADKLNKKHLSQYDFKSKIENLICEQVIARRIELEKSGAEPLQDYFSMCLIALNDEIGYSFNFIENKFSEKQKKWFKELLGETNFTKISCGLSDEVQQIFHFLLLSLRFDNYIPNLDELKDIDKKENLFWQYASMSKGEYRDMYLEAAKEVIKKTLPKEKEAKLNKKAAAPHVEDGKKKAAGNKTHVVFKKKTEKPEEENDPDMEVSDKPIAKFVEAWNKHGMSNRRKNAK